MTQAGRTQRLFVSCGVCNKLFNIGLSDTALMDMVVSNLQQQRAVTEQLRREAAIKRIPVSQAVADIIKFIVEHEQEDCLLVGFSSQRINPFREKSSCTLI
ncbi:G protein gamma 1 [Carabus blaptoides fortunei]